MRPRAGHGLLAGLAVAIGLAPGTVRAQETVAAPDSTMVQDVHPQDTGEDRGLRIVSRDRRVALRILGSVRMVGIYDFDGLESASFKPIDIPVGAANVPDPSFQMNADQTRMGLELNRTLPNGRDIFARVEMDFHDDGHVRLRHAYASASRFLVGQTWTTISDVGALPLTVDLEGPNSAITLRNPQVRWSRELPSGAGVAIAAESPVSEVAQTDSITVENQFLPDLTARYRRSTGVGHIQIAAVFRQFTYRYAEESLTYLVGGGLAVSGTFIFDETMKLMYQGVYGAGISRYVGTFAGEGLDLVPSEDGTRLVPLPAGGGYVAVRIRWAKFASSNLVLGTAFTDRSVYQPPDAYANGQYIAINAFLEPVQGLRLGIEYLFGRRESYDGETGLAQRFQFGTYFDF